MTWSSTANQVFDTQEITLQKINQAGIGAASGSSAQILYYDTDPNAEAIVPDDLASPALAYPRIAGNGALMFWDNGGGVWF